MTNDLSELQARREWDARWTRDVRDPAERKTEGYRVLQVNGADAEYEIAPLLDGRWALHTSLKYHCGSCHSSALPWKAYDTRDECVALFLARARQHFGPELVGGSVTNEQRAARQAILTLLDDGLFGFIEPDVDELRTRSYAKLDHHIERLWAAHRAARKAR